MIFLSNSRKIPDNRWNGYTSAIKLSHLGFWDNHEIIFIVFSQHMFCYTNRVSWIKNIDVRFSCVCPVIDNEFRNNIV